MLRVIEVALSGRVVAEAPTWPEAEKLRDQAQDDSLRAGFNLNQVRFGIRHTDTNPTIVGGKGQSMGRKKK